VQLEALRPPKADCCAGKALHSIVAVCEGLADEPFVLAKPLCSCS